MLRFGPAINRGRRFVKIFTGALLLGAAWFIGINFWLVNVSARFRPPCRYAMYREIQRFCDLLGIDREKCISWGVLHDEVYLEKQIENDALVSPEYRECWKQKQRRRTRCHVPYPISELFEQIYSKIKGTPFYDLNEECPGWNKLGDVPGRADLLFSPQRKGFYSCFA